MYEALTNKTLRGSDGESHADVEDDGQEVSDGVGDGGRQTEKGSEAQDLQIARPAQVLAQVERLKNNIVAVLFDPSTHESDLLLVEERQRSLGALSGELGKVDDGESANGSDDDGDEALHDEDPAPARDAGHDAAGSRGVRFGGAVVLAVVRAQVAQAVHVPEAVGQDSREGRAHAADQVEDCVALL